MKREKRLSGLMAWLLTTLMAVAGLGCLTTGFRLQADMLDLSFFTAMMSAVVCLLFSSRSGPVIFLCLTALGLGFLIREGSLVLQVESLLYAISELYDQGYGCGVIRWSSQYLGDIPWDNGLKLIAFLCILPAAWALIRRKKLLIPVLLGMTPLFVCLGLTDTVPNSGWLMLLLISILLMILPNGVRRINRKAGLRLTAILLLPVILFSVILFSAVPQDNDGKSLEAMREEILSWVLSLPFVMESESGQIIITLNGESSNYMNLANVGPMRKTSYAVMDVVSTSTGHIYLRGQSFDVYDGVSWSATPITNEHESWPHSSQLISGPSITITLRGNRDYYYTPYYVTDMGPITQGKYPKNKSEKEYSFRQYLLRSDAPTMMAIVPTDCLQLPEAVRKAANAYVNDNLFVGSYGDGSFNSIEAFARAIGEMVERSAEYSLNTQRMPEGETDFVSWFLNESETGYCVHFASAAAVLLRSQGIPARYVTGYTCQTRSGRRVTVKAEQAHAWVEYYDTDLACWRVLDPTPAGSGGGTPPVTSATAPPVPTAPTVPTETETVPTIPTEPIATLPEITEPSVTLPTPTENTTPTRPTTPVETPTEPGVIPGPGGSGSTWDPEALWEMVLPYLKIFLWFGVIFGSILGQFLLRRRYRRKKMSTGAHNRRALACWQESLRLGKQIGAIPPDRLKQLAEKAKFSQHTLTEGELEEFDLWNEASRQALRNLPWYRRILCRLIWAI